MTNVQQIGEDLKFVREAVDRRGASEQFNSAWLIYWVWAVYVLVGYILIDLSPPVAGWFFMIAGIAGGFVSWRIAKRHAAVVGEVDRVAARTEMLHWPGGMVVSYASALGLATVIPALRGEAGSQVFVVLIGMVYYFWGVHRERAFRWLGIVLIVGGICVSLIPHFRWTCLGVVIAGGLIATSFIHRPRKDRTRIKTDEHE